MSNASNTLGTTLSIFSFFCLMSKIDYIIHGSLYNYGLEFSYEWANEYWATYTLTFVVFSLIVGLMHWLNSDRTVSDLKFSLWLIATVNLLMIGGLADIMFFVFWGGGLPPNDAIWWWVPWYHILGTWTSSMQIVLAASTFTATVLLWLMMARDSILLEFSAYPNHF